MSWLVDHPPLSWVIDEPVHDHVREHRYTNVMLGTLVVLLIGLLGRRIAGDAVGLVAAGLAIATVATLLEVFARFLGKSTGTGGELIRLAACRSR